MYKYDIDSGRFSLIIDLDKEAQDEGLDNRTSWHLYGCSLRPHPVTDRLYLSLFHYFQDPTYKLRVTDADGVKVREVDMISNYWFPSLPVFPDNCGPVAHGPGEITLEGNGPWTLTLEDLFTDEDSMEAAIVKTVTGVSDPEAFSARFVNGKLVITPRSLSGISTGSVDIKANSNGQLASLTLNIKFPSAGMEAIEADQSAICYYSLDGHLLNARPEAPGVYICKSGNRVSKIMIK